MNTIEQLQNHRYVNIPYPEELRAHIEAADAAWKQFCTLEEETKLQLGFGNQGGYELKSHDDHHDAKELLHFSLGAAPQFMSYAESLTPEAKTAIVTLVNESTQVIEKSRTIIEQFLTDIENHTGQDNLTAASLDAVDEWVIRFLHYFPVTKEVEATAAPHCDIGGFTLHLFQDYPGLEYYDGETWHPVDLAEDRTSILPGMGMQHRTKSKIDATCHRVVPTKESQETGRYSAVLFCVWPDGGRWNKEEFGGMSNQAPGFNYNLPFSDLDAFFIEGKTLSDV